MRNSEKEYGEVMAVIKSEKFVSLAAGLVVPTVSYVPKELDMG